MTDRLRAAAQAAIGAMVRAAITGHSDALDGYAEALRAALAEQDAEPLHKGCAECCDRDPGLALYCVRCIDKMGEADLNLSCKSVQKRLATQWGFVPKGSDDV